MNIAGIHGEVEPDNVEWRSEVQGGCTLGFREEIRE